jgi:phosphoglycolate phosphatase-like HAD superfamily hydrolase
MLPTVVLFDIDGTLVSTGGAGRRAMVGAFAQVHGRSDAFEELSFAGMTDRAIARHGLATVGVPVAESAIDRVLEAYLALLIEELGRADAFRVLPGVLELLASLRDAADVAVGLGTGNVRRGAYAKLARGALDGAFAFGGFGCDAEDRVELLRAGAKRGAAAIGAPLEECRVVVIGDTPKDVAAARGIGARCLAVATGMHRAEDLASCKPHRVFATLADEGVGRALFDE